MPGPVPQPSGPPQAGRPETPSGNNNVLVIAAVVVAVLAVAGGAFLLLSGGDDGDPETETAGSQTDDTAASDSSEDTAGPPNAETVDGAEAEAPEVDNSDDILAAYQTALDAFAEADCAALEEVTLVGAPLPVSNCAMLETALGNTYEFTDVQLVEQSADEAFVSHTLYLTSQGVTDELQGIGCVVLEDGAWMVANFHAADPTEPGCRDQLLEEGESGGAGTTAPPLGEPTPPPTGAWLEFHDELAQNCFDGNMVDCDYIYDGTAFSTEGPDGDSDGEEHPFYGATCGGRLEEPANGECAAWYGSHL